MVQTDPTEVKYLCDVAAPLMVKCVIKHAYKGLERLTEYGRVPEFSEGYQKILPDTSRRTWDTVIHPVYHTDAYMNPVSKSFGSTMKTYACDRCGYSFDAPYTKSIRVSCRCGRPLTNW